jgi:hypothetical protein
MTTVNVSGTWSEKQRPLNGLSTHARAIREDRTLRVPVVAYVEFHQFAEKLTGNVLTVAIGAIEPATEPDGADPSGLGKQVMDLLDQLRKQRGKGSVDEVPSHSGELSGQEAFDFDGAGDGEPARVGEVRLTGDGPREVPEPSAEEILAERAEAKAKGRGKAAADPFVPPTGGAA